MNPKGSAIECQDAKRGPKNPDRLTIRKRNCNVGHADALPGKPREALGFGEPEHSVKGRARRRFAAQAVHHQIMSISGIYRNINTRRYSGIIPSVPNHVSTNRGHCAIGNLLVRRPKACPPCAYRCISVGTPAFCSAT